MVSTPRGMEYSRSYFYSSRGVWRPGTFWFQQDIMFLKFQNTIRKSLPIPKTMSKKGTPGGWSYMSQFIQFCINYDVLYRNFVCTVVLYYQFVTFDILRTLSWPCGSQKPIVCINKVNKKSELIIWYMMYINDF